MNRPLLQWLGLWILLNASSANGGDPFRVATWNVHWSNRQWSDIAKQIRVSAADVVCLQETSPNLERYLGDRLKPGYPHLHATGHQGRYRAERLTLISKSPLRRVRFHPPQAGMFGFVSACLDHQGTEIQIVNVHLSPIRIPPHGGLRGMMTALNRVEKKHLQEAETILIAIDDATAAIIAGDFNSPANFNAAALLKRRGFTDSYQAVHDKADRNPTWIWPHGRIPLQMRIDFIFHSEHFASASSRIVKAAGSDHAIVISELKFAARDRQ